MTLVSCLPAHAVPVGLIMHGSPVPNRRHPLSAPTGAPAMAS